MTRELTGRHVLVIALVAFGTIVAANLTMLFAATGSFPGLVVKNSYVASQGWNARAAAQRDLGWQTQLGYTDGVLRIGLLDSGGARLRNIPLVVSIGRPSTDVEDRDFEVPAGQSTLRVDLDPGVWRVTLRAESPAFSFADTIQVPEAQ